MDHFGKFVDTLKLFWTILNRFGHYQTGIDLFEKC